MGYDALLESPTGTGKTICLLSACIAFMKQQRERETLDIDSMVPPELAGIPPMGFNRKPPITLIYCTRTHSQIQQVLEEIRDVLPYQVNAQVLASKSQLCINPALKGSKLDSHMMNRSCKMLRDSKMQTSPINEEEKDEDLAQILRSLKPNTTKEMQSACKYYSGEEVRVPITYEESMLANGVNRTQAQRNSKAFHQAYSERRFNPVIDRKVDELSSGQNKHLLDVEDLCKIGKSSDICPYYYARSKLPSSDIVIAPYSYILDPELRKTLQVDLKNAIIVFDEAHNIDAQCEEIMSYDLTMECFSHSIKYIELVKIQARLQCESNQNYQAFKLVSNIEKLQEFLLKWVKALDNAAKKKTTRQEKVAGTNISLYTITFQEYVRDIFDTILFESGDPLEIQYDNETQDNQEMLAVEQNQGSRMYPSEYGPSNYLTGNIAQRTIYNDLFSVNPFRDVLEEHNGAGRRGFKQIKKNHDQVIEASFQELMSVAYDVMRSDLTLPKGQLEEGYRQSNHQEGLTFIPFSQIHKQGKNKLSRVLECLQKMKRIRYLPNRSAAKDFIGFVKVNNQNQAREVQSFGLMCLNPSYIFQRLVNEEQPRSIILTSGTLSPLNFVQSELKTKFKVQLENQHIIDRKRVLLRIIDKGPNGTPLKFTYDAQGAGSKYLEIGHIIEQMAPSIQGGILVYFTSYKILTDCFQAWEGNNLTFAGTRIFKEDKDHTKLMAIFADYSKHIESHGKAIFLCSCRGKMNEGLNFNDQLARACFVIGIPYLLVNDARVLLKRRYLDGICHQPQADLHRDRMSYHSQMVSSGREHFREGSEQIRGTDWYKITAIREVNQIIGRCIRHKNDYSSIFLVDKRYKDYDHMNLLPKWVAKPVYRVRNMREGVADLKHFFQVNQDAPVQQSQGEMINTESRILSNEIIYEDLDESSHFDEQIGLARSETSSSSMPSYDLGGAGCIAGSPSIEIYQPSASSQTDTSIIEISSSSNTQLVGDDLPSLNQSQLQQALHDSSSQSSLISICSEELGRCMESLSQINEERNLAKRSVRDEDDFDDPDDLLSQYFSQVHKRVNQ